MSNPSFLKVCSDRIYRHEKYIGFYHPELRTRGYCGCRADTFAGKVVETKETRLYVEDSLRRLNEYMKKYNVYGFSGCAPV